MSTLEYAVKGDLGIVTVWPNNLPTIANRDAFAVELDESDLTMLLNQLQGVTAYTPDPRTGEL